MKHEGDFVLHNSTGISPLYLFAIKSAGQVDIFGKPTWNIAQTKMSIFLQHCEQIKNEKKVETEVERKIHNHEVKDWTCLRRTGYLKYLAVWLSDICHFMLRETTKL